MNWTYAILIFAAAVAALRIVTVIRRVRGQQSEGWDERLVKRVRAQGGDPFKPVEVDFFFDLPSNEACEGVRDELVPEEFVVDFRPMAADMGNDFTLHARKALRMSVTEMQGWSQRFEALASKHGGRYDGWAAPGVTRSR
jgi:Regulator of ribonuclease activity B